MEQMYDVIVIGGGPAGLTAALYLARAKYRVLVLEKAQFGGQISITDEVVNYPGVEKVSGKHLTETMRRQAEAFGAEFELDEATMLETQGDFKVVRTKRGQFRCFGVLLAVGAQPKRVGFTGEQAYQGKGVAYCATCDGEFFTGKEIYVVGGGYAAAEESVFLTKFARHVTVLMRRDDFSCAASVAERAKNHEKITVLPNTVLEEVGGEAAVRYLRYRNTVTGEVTEVNCPAGENMGVFVFAGYAPDTTFLKDVVELDEQGYLVTDATQKTSVEGVYAAGDVCVKTLRQVVTATGDGALAATELEKYAARMQQKTDLHPSVGIEKQTREDEHPQLTESDGLFDGQMRGQLEDVFSRMEQALILKLYLDDSPLSAQLQQMVTAMAALTEKLTVTVAPPDPTHKHTPYVAICRENGAPTGLAFHGVPGGHEFSSFVLGLYNAAGPGQKLSIAEKQEIAAIREPVELQILVTLSCGMCPELVVAAQRIAAENDKVQAHVYDVRHFEDLRERYGVMSVPCLVINGENPSFGKKNLAQLLWLIRERKDSKTSS